ncbi:MAG: LiaF domain-containing protein [Gemmatimonadaceae bacterium]
MYFDPVNPDPKLSSKTPPRSSVIPSEFVPEKAGTVAFFSSQNRQGEWLLPRLFRVVSVIGNVEIDLTRARVGSGVSRIEVLAIFGNVEIKVPPEMRVECDGAGIAANFESDTRAQQLLSPDAPVISVGGTAYFANVEIKVIDPNEPTFLERITSSFRREK